LEGLSATRGHEPASGRGGPQAVARRLEGDLGQRVARDRRVDLEQSVAVEGPAAQAQATGGQRFTLEEEVETVAAQELGDMRGQRTAQCREVGVVEPVGAV